MKKLRIAPPPERSRLTRHIGFCKNFSYAFTLAEVLITLGIIGVVAAITMPTLIANYQKKQTVAQLKKVYSVLNQALQKSIVENGGNFAVEYIPPNPNVSGSAYGGGDPGFQYLIPYLDVADTFNRNKKWHDKSKGYQIYKANGEGESQFNNCIFESPNAYILKDGTIILFANFLNYSPMGNSLYILVDLNGFKSPNRIGRDVFVFTLSKTKPDIIDTPSSNKTVDELIANKNSCPQKGEISGYQGYVGSGCSTIIMKDGWEIKDHYPWW